MKRLFTVFASLLTQGAKEQKTKMMYVVMTIVMMVFAPQGVKADLVTDAVYDFSGSAYGSNGNDGNMTTEYSSETIKIGSTTCTYFQTLGNVSNPGRFAAQVTTFSLRKSSGNNPTYGLNLTGYGTNQYRMFAITGLNKGSIVTVEGSANFDLSSGSNSANINGNKYTMTEQGSLALSIPGSGWIYRITIQHDDAAYWAYDPAIESYDLYWVNKNTEISTSDAGFALNVSGENAQYLSISSPTLNNRIAISQKYSAEGHHFTTDELWTFGRDGYGDESQGLLVKIGWNNLSICNLKEGDRVRLTLSGQATFSSKGQNGGYDGCSAFKDINCNGDQDEGEVSITPGLPVESPNNNGGNYKSYFYTITEDGHLDIGLSEGSRLCQVEIYADHQAKMIDRDNALDSKTSYFDTTGQLEAKHHIVPGGLHVYIGNDSPNEHAEVVMSDKGPVSFVYDDLTWHDANSHHYKMARHPAWASFNVWNDLPATGTYYKFVPEVDGKMWIKFKAVSVNYRNYGLPGTAVVDNNGTPNEVTNNANCPYYLMVTPGNGEAQFSQVEDPHYYRNGADGYFGNDNGNPTEGIGKGIDVKRGKTYYLYGWWDNTDNAFDWQNNHGCGIAELIEVTFKPNKIVTPLAKWVDSGTTSDDHLATVRGYNHVIIKKKSDNIASCTAKIEGDKLKISNITFVDENKGGGTILLALCEKRPGENGEIIINDTDPVFAYTIAYNAGYNKPQGAVRSEGHTWDFSTNPLNGLKWNNKNAEADVTSFGTRFNNFATANKDDNGIPTNGVNSSSLLTEEINKGDWTFNYRVKKNGQFHDPRFLNNWDMEGDNADMMWDTEGLIIKAGSSQSCIFNEFQGQVQHTETDDPDRYVGFLPGSELIIPKLKKNDRVIIYMGSGNGSGQTAMKFKITNALDALYNPIDETDEYWAGGSQWNIPTSDVREYHGCYHFFAAADGDMKLKMSSGSMCKLYSVKIYRGDHEDTNGILDQNNGGYTLLTTDGQGGETKTWSLHYRGKGETLADGNGKFLQENEIIAQTGKISNTAITTNGNNFSYTSTEGDLGTIRVRVKCMEYNHNYVTDYADRNLTLAYHKTMNYPYTWDFMDMDVAEFSGDDIDAEWTRNKGVSDNIEENKPYETSSAYNLSMWDVDGYMRVNSQGPNNDPHNYNYIFQNLKGDNGNQLWANNDILPETQGLWFYMDNNDPVYSGCMKIDADGLHLANPSYENGAVVTNARRGWWNYKMVVPSVPAGAAVYLRMARDESVSKDEITYTNNGTSVTEKYFYKMYQFAHMSAKAEIADGTNCRFYQAEDGSDDYIVAIKNTGAESNLTFTLNGWTLKKLSISTDPKKVNVRGWATESRNHVIDPELTAYMTGKDFETCLVTGVDYKKKTITLTRVYPSANNTNYIMTSLADEQTGASIIHNKAAKTLSADDGEVKILDNGFHLFVPDMHDYDRVNVSNSLKTLTDNSSMLVAQVSPTTSETKIPGQSNDKEYTNYALTYKHFKLDADGNKIGNNTVEGEEAFYRIAATGATSSGNQGYLPLLTAYVNPSSSSYGTNPTPTTGNEGESGGNAKFSIIFEGEFEVNSGIATQIENVETTGRITTAEGFYNLNGQKINGIPTQKGLYIVNGKKVLVK